MTNDFPRFDLTGQVALVTGAARGLGRAISLALAHAGADVALGLRDINTGRELAKEIEALDRRALPLQMDMTQLDQVSRAVEDTAAQFRSLDILVNNAGVAPENPAEDVREQDFDLTLAVNLKGTFFASQAAGRLMIRQNRGCIVNMSSQAGFVVLPTESIYCMTKAAIAHLTKCLAVEWGKYNIRVNAVARHSSTLRVRSRRWQTRHFATTSSSVSRRFIVLVSPWMSPAA
jgi:NAD(P)-dependent dehydrogenase (short-subunit alcohol dehydrogenase family)